MDSRRKPSSPLPGSGHSVVFDPDDADYILFESPVAPVALFATKYRPSSLYNLESGSAFHGLVRLHAHAEANASDPTASAIAYHAGEDAPHPRSMR